MGNSKNLSRPAGDINGSLGPLAMLDYPTIPARSDRVSKDMHDPSTAYLQKEIV